MTFLENNFHIIFTIMFTMVPFFFVLVFGIIIFSFKKGFSQWKYNNKQPVLSVQAKIVSKRTNTSHSCNNMNEHISTSTSTSYFVTFEVESGDRMELHLGGSEYGLLAEGDIGKLTFQGTRYLNFERYKTKENPDF